MGNIMAMFPFFININFKKYMQICFYAAFVQILHESSFLKVNFNSVLPQIARVNFSGCHYYTQPGILWQQKVYSNF